MTFRTQREKRRWTFLIPVQDAAVAVWEMCANFRYMTKEKDNNGTKGQRAEPLRRVLLTTPNYGKLVDVVLVLLNKAAAAGLDVTQYDLAKAVFIADRRRLNEFDRPITYDVYAAMVHGPVPLTFFRLLKENPKVLARTGPVQWKRRPDEKNPKIFHYFAPMREANTEIFAPNDILALEEALVFVKKAGITEVRRQTHRDPAYKAARRDDPIQKSFLMNYALMRDEVDETLAMELAARSRRFRPS